ncbi:pseudaminic acid cytidylyltransferase [Planktomarina sp.]|nr:pseudaminic acid cytidylyltransferase [Planktomarina sp.]
MDTGSLLIIIPARGGSKRIPRKNIKEICGQPMIYWPLMELSKKFSSKQILVSTDSSEIISTVEKKGIKIPFIRPDSLSGCFTATFPVAAHALAWFEKNVSIMDYVLIVYPTAVLLDINDISSAFSLLNHDNDCDLVMSATNFAFPIQRAVFQNNEGYAEMFEPENVTTRSQDLTEAMHDAGQFYLFRSGALRDEKTLVDLNVKLKLLDRNKVVDIDTLEDFGIANAKMKMLALDKRDFNWNFD